MRKYVIVVFAATLLLTSCTDNKSQEAMQSLESTNKVLQEQIESLEKENQKLQNQNKDLSTKIKDLNDRVDKKESRIDDLRDEVDRLEKSQSFVREDFEVTERKIVELDLDGDEEKEFIKLETGANKFYRLSINDISLIGVAENVDYKFKVVDLNEEDGIKEIAISELGTDDNPSTTFYRYCIHNISFVGKVSGHIDDMKINRDGSLVTSTDGDILHSWSYRDKYILTPEHVLVSETKELFEMNHKVKVLKSIPLLKSTTENEMVAALTVGEEIVILASDNKKWCQVKKENGVKGWFELEGFDKIKGTEYKATEVFEGLNK